MMVLAGCSRLWRLGFVELNRLSATDLSNSAPNGHRACFDMMLRPMSRWVSLGVGAHLLEASAEPERSDRWRSRPVFYNSAQQRPVGVASP
jgi:hypothetical protein